MDFSYQVIEGHKPKGWKSLTRINWILADCITLWCLCVHFNIGNLNIKPWLYPVSGTQHEWLLKLLCLLLTFQTSLKLCILLLPLLKLSEYHYPALPPTPLPPPHFCVCPNVCLCVPQRNRQNTNMHTLLHNGQNISFFYITWATDWQQKQGHYYISAFFPLFLWKHH